MNLADASLIDLLGAILGFVLTLFVFSYILGDNFLFRFAVYVFIGVAAGYAAVMVFYNVIWPQLVDPLLFGSRSQRLFAIIPLAMSILLLLRTSSRLSVLSTPIFAYLVGVGAAAAIGGAVIGTVVPQVNATIDGFDLFSIQAVGEDYWLRVVERFGNASIILLGTLTTLIYFHFGIRSTRDISPRRAPWIEGIAWIGQIFIAITLGTVFAGVFASALAALVERLSFMLRLIFSFFA